MRVLIIVAVVAVASQMVESQGGPFGLFNNQQAQDEFIPGPQAGPPSFLPAFGAIPAAADFCFAEDQEVTTPHGKKMMKHLNIGDEVLTAEKGRLSFSPVESWLHRYADGEYKMLRMVMDDGTELKVTPEHFIYHTPCQGENNEWTLSFSKEVVPGKDCVLKVESDESVKKVGVVSSEHVLARGAYGPMTANTNIVVNGVAASCHAVVKDPTLLNSLLAMAQAFDSICDSASAALGFSSDHQHLNEMPGSLTALKAFAETIFPQNWKIMG